MTYKYYFQIDFVDEDGYTNLIDRFNVDLFAIEPHKQDIINRYYIIKNAFACFHNPSKTKVVLDLYKYENNEEFDTDEFLCNILGGD